MEVILLERINNLGSLGDKVNVKSGFARNYLIPQGKARRATKENIAYFEQRRAELEKQAQQQLEHAQQRAAALKDLTLTVISKVGNEGRLFGSVGTIEIIEAMATLGHEIERKEVRLPDGNIREVGEYEIGLHLHSDVDVEIKLQVVGEE